MTIAKEFISFAFGPDIDSSRATTRRVKINGNKIANSRNWKCEFTQELTTVNLIDRRRRVAFDYSIARIGSSDWMSSPKWKVSDVTQSYE